MFPSNQQPNVAVVTHIAENDSIIGYKDQLRNNRRIDNHRTINSDTTSSNTTSTTTRATSCHSNDPRSVREHYKDLAYINNTTAYNKNGSTTINLTEEVRYNNNTSVNIPTKLPGATKHIDGSFLSIESSKNSGISDIEIAEAYLVDDQGQDDEETKIQRQEELDRTKIQAENMKKEKEDIENSFAYWKRILFVGLFVIVGTVVAIGVFVSISNGDDENETTNDGNKEKTQYTPFTSTTQLYEAVDNYLFYGEHSLAATEYGYPMGIWDVSRITNFTRVFDPNREETFDFHFVNTSYVFNEDISNWNVSSAETMWGMFKSATEFNQDLSKWDVGRVQNFDYVFAQAKKFNQDLSTWKTGNVETMSHMFYGAYSFNGNIMTWDVSSAKATDCMFHNATSFNQDISNWDISNVKNAITMFLNASSFQQDLCKWGDTLSIDSHHEEFSFAEVAGESIFKGSKCMNDSSPSSLNGPWCTPCM